MNELIKNIEILANQVLITLKKDKITYNEFFIAYNTYLYIINPPTDNIEIIVKVPLKIF